jgi:AcrR family transcriptional regulator
MQKRSQETRTHILRAALDEFSQHGYDATGVVEICLAAGVSKGAFYHHFPSKQALFLELLRNWLALLDQQIAAARDRSLNVPQTMLSMTDLMTQVYQAAGEHLPMFLEFWSQARRDPAVWNEVIAPYKRYSDFFAGMIQEGIREGSIKQVNPLDTARVMVSLAVGLLLQGLLDQQGADWGSVTRNGFRILVDAISTEGK